MPLLGKRKKEDGEEDLTALKSGKLDGLFSDAFSSLSRTGRVRKKSAKLMEMESMSNMEAPDDSEENMNKALKFNQGINFPLPKQNIFSLNQGHAIQGKLFTTYVPNRDSANNMMSNNLKLIQGTSIPGIIPKNENMTRLVMNQNILTSLNMSISNMPSNTLSVNTTNPMLIRGQMLNLQNNSLQRPQQMILIRNTNPTSLRPQQMTFQSQANLQNKNMLTLNTLNTLQPSSLRTNIGGNLNSHLILKGDPFLNQHSSLGIGSGSRIVNLGNNRMPISIGGQGIINFNNMINARNVVPGSNIQISGLNLNARNIQILNDPRKFQMTGINNNQLANLRAVLGSNAQSSSQKFTDVFANFVTQPVRENSGMSINAQMDHNISPNKIMSAFSNVNEESLDGNDLDEDLDIDDQELQSLIVEGGGSLNDSLSAQFGLTPKGAKKRKKITAYTLWCVNQRKNLKPGLEFGQISKILGDAWSALPYKEKLVWKRRAKKMTEKFQASLALDPPGSESTGKKRHYTPRRTSNIPSKRGKYKKRGGADFTPNDDSMSPGNQASRYAYEMNYTFKVSGTEAIDAAAYLKLLGECLSNLGERLMEHVGQIAVQGSLSVLLDSLICALGPLMCLTAYIPCHKLPLDRGSADPEGTPQDEDSGGEEYGIDVDQCSGVMANILDNIAYIMPGL